MATALTISRGHTVRPSSLLRIWGPSLRTRVDDLSGKLFLTSSGEGTDIRIEVPA